MPAKSGQVTFRCDPELQAAFLAACQRKDITASQIFRQAMRDFVNANPQADLPLAAPKGRKPRS